MTGEAGENVAVGEDTDTYSLEFGWEDDRSVSTSVLAALKAVSGRDPTDLPPLHTAVEVDALNRLFQPRENGQERAAGTLSFPYAGYHVTVHAEGIVVVTEDDV